MSEALWGEPDAALDAIDVALDCLLDADYARLSRDEFLAVLRHRETVRRRDEALDHVLIAHAAERGFAADLSVPSTQALLVGLLRISPREASRRVKAAGLLGPRRAITGEPLEPLFPLVAEALAEGALSTEHASVITDMVNRLPDPIRAEHANHAERELVELALTFHPGQLAVLGRQLAAQLNPDGVQPDDEERHRRRDVTLSLGPDGMGALKGTLTPECLEALHTALDPLTKPCSTPGMRDTRTAGQRRHDALHELGRRLIAAGDLPDTGGTSTTILVTLALSDLEKRTGYARTGHGGTMSIHELVRHAAETEVIPVFMTDTGGILAYGRARRLASGDQRRVLTARDRGCTFPACDRPAAWCQPHHVNGWHPDGLTDVDNLALTCQFHNLEAERSQWRCVMINDRPWWVPPPWIDLHQRPLRNTAHDPGGPTTDPRSWRPGP